VSPTKEKEAVRTQKKDSREYHKREGSREGSRYRHKREGAMSTTKEKAALGTQNKAHCFRRRKREYEVMIIENKTKFRGG